MPVPVDPLPAGAVARFGSPRLQDFSIARFATFSPDAKLLATSGPNSPICVWDTATGALVRTHPKWLASDLRWRPDGQLAALTPFGNNSFLMFAFGDAKDLTPEQAGTPSGRGAPA